MLVLFHLLAHERTHQIVRCPECRTLFYRIGKQQYCSRPCSNRANVRTWRQREEVKVQEQERAHERYVKKQKKIHPGAKVTPNPRRRSTDHAETSRES